jgi:hypothetical protein
MREWRACVVGSHVTVEIVRMSASPSPRHPAGARPSGFPLAPYERALIKREIARGPLTDAELAADLRSHAQEGLPMGAPVHAKALERLLREDRQRDVPALVDSVSYTLEALVEHVDWNSGLLGGVAQAAIAAGARTLAEAEGCTVSLRAVRRALRWLEDERGVAIHRVHGHGKPGAPAAMKCQQSRARCIALTARSRGRRHCGWHHGARTYELLVRTSEDYRRFVSGRVAKRSAHRLAKSSGTHLAAPRQHLAARTLTHASPDLSRSPSPPRSGGVTFARTASATPTTDARPSGANILVAEPPPPLSGAPIGGRAVGEQGALHGPTSVMSVETNAVQALEPQTRPSDPRGLRPDVREAAESVLAVYRKTFAQHLVGEPLMPGETDEITRMLELGFTAGQLSLAIVVASKTARNQAGDRHALGALMLPQVIRALVHRAKGVGVASEPAPGIRPPSEPAPAEPAESGVFKVAAPVEPDEPPQPTVELDYEIDRREHERRIERRREAAPIARGASSLGFPAKRPSQPPRPMTPAEAERLQRIETARLEAVSEGDDMLAVELDRLRTELLARVNGGGESES